MKGLPAWPFARRPRGIGYEVHGPVSSGKAAIASALALRPDVILMDVFLKGPMNGFQAAEVIRSQYRCPVIYVSGSSDRLEHVLANLPEPCSVVLKPIDEHELHTAIEKALQQSTSTQETVSRVDD